MSHEFPRRAGERFREQPPLEKVEGFMQKAEAFAESNPSDAHVALCKALDIVIAQQLGKELYDELNEKLDAMEVLMAVEAKEKERLLDEKRKEQALKPGIVSLEKQSPFIDAWSDVAVQEFGYEILSDEEGNKVVENKKDGLRISISHTATTAIASISSLSNPENSSAISFNIVDQDMKTTFENVISKFEARYEQDRPLQEEEKDGQALYEEQQDQIELQEDILDKSIEHEQEIEKVRQQTLDMMKGEGEASKE